MTLEEVENLLLQATTILSQVALGLQEAKKPQQPAQVMSRIAAARSEAMQRGFRMPAVMSLVQTKPAKERKERAYHYLRLASRSDETNDKIYRVVGKAALAESNRIETEVNTDPTMLAERLDSRAFDVLVKRRLKQIRDGATSYVGSTQAEDLKVSTTGDNES